jgi:hypothetical protein
VVTGGADNGRTKYLIQFFLPIRAHPTGESDDFQGIRRQLADRFGGVTAYVRSPATGLWKHDDASIEGDQVVMIEVEAATLDRNWWRTFRQDLERTFHQDTVMIRAIEIQAL